MAVSLVKKPVVSLRKAAPPATMSNREFLSRFSAKIGVADKRLVARQRLYFLWLYNVAVLG